MGIIKKLLGGPDFAMVADDAAPTPVQEAVTVIEESPDVEKVEEPAEAVADAASDVTEAAPAKKRSKRKKKATKATSTAAAGSTAAPASAPVTEDPIQALIDAALAQTAPKAETEEEAAQTFATDYLLTPSMSRRRPGPSLDGFKGMASTMRRR